MENIPTRQNNPGDIKVNGKIAMYNSPMEGKAALYNDLTAKMTGTSTTGIGPDSSLVDFAKVYAPDSDGNDSLGYAANLANKLGVSPDTKIGSLTGRIDDFANAVSSNEGYQGASPGGNQAQSTSTNQPPVTPLQIPAGVSTDGADSSDGQDPGFLKGLSEDLTGTNPEGIGTQLANTVKGVGNFLFPIVGDVGNDLTGKNDKSFLQQAGDLGLSVLPFIPGLGEAGEVLRGGDAAVEGAADVAKSGLLKKALTSTIGKGAVAGYGAGSLSNLSNGQGLVQSITPNSTNIEGALTGGVASAVLPKAAGLLKGKDANAGIDKSIQEVMPLENKNTRIDALRSSLPDASNGGVVRKGMLGTSTIVPDAEDTARGAAAHPFISSTKDPVVKIQNLNQGIKDVSNQTDRYLDNNAAPSNFADMRDYMETNKSTSRLQKDPGAADAYNRATQDALDTLYSTMKQSATESGDFGANTSGADIRKARISIDSQISKELGENTFGTPQYKGIKAAEIDTRNLLNRMSEDMLRYPGKLENVNRMNEFIAASKGRGIEVDMNNPDVKAQIEKAFGLVSSPEAEAKAQALADAHKKMSYLYESRDNLIDKYQKKIGNNKLGEAADRSPLVRAGIGIAKKAIPFGIGTHL